MNSSTPWFKNLWLKSLGLKGPGLKLGVKKSGVEMSFNRFLHCVQTDPLAALHQLPASGPCLMGRKGTSINYVSTFFRLVKWPKKAVKSAKI